MKKVLSSKALKLLTLLLTSMLIASASAAVYFSISMEPTVTIKEAVVQFAQGSDWSHVAGSIGPNNTWCSLSLKAYPNATLTYEQPLNISNTAGTSKSIKLRHVSISPESADASVSNFTFIKFVLMDASGNPVSGGSFNYTTSDDNWNLPSSMSYKTISPNTKWTVRIETKAAAGATKDIAASIVIAVDVQE
jgi:hypothetical protein